MRSGGVRTAVGLGAILLLGSAAGASGPLTWEDVVRRAAAQNPELAAARASEDAARARRASSVNGFLPSVSLAQRVSRSDGAERTWSASADASLDLLNVGAWAGVRSADASLREARHQRQLASADLRLNLFTAYAGLLFAQRQIVVAQKIRDLRNDNAQMVDLKYRSGREYKGNGLRAAAERAQAEADLAQAQRDLSSAQSALCRQMGDETYEVGTVTGTLAVPPASARPDWNALIADHPRVRLAESRVDAARAAYQKARGGLAPTLSVGYSRRYDGPDFFPDGPHWTASGVLNWPIFGKGLTAAFFDAAAARRDWKAREEDLRAARLELRRSLESAWSDWAARADRVAVQNQFLAAIEQQNSEASIRYASGLMSFENWEQVVTDLVNVERSALQAERDAAVAEAAWRNARGVPLEDQ